MNPSCDFRGQVALVTGAASGRGRATAWAFAEGAAVTLGDTGAEKLRQMAEELKSAGHLA